MVVAVFLMPVFGCSQGDTRATSAAGRVKAPIDGDFGFRDFSFGADNVRSPTSEKPPQSRLWFNDGAWWGVLFDDSTEKYYVYRYEWGAHAWSRTGTVIDDRNSAGVDVLWDGTHLYVATAGPSSDSDYHSARVLRYGYDAAIEAYSPDSGFPVTVASGGTEAIVLAKDTTGKLWVTYTQDDKVYVNHSLDDDLGWAKPFVLPVRGTTLDADDVSSVIAFDSQIGVMWSNQAEGTTYFATHRDGDAEDAWQAEPALQGPGAADDHINLKADSGGRVFAAVKTSFDESEGSDPSTPVNLLLVRDRDGGWSRHTFGRKRDKSTKPMVLLDEEHGDLYMFATNPCCEGGSIYYKRTGMDDISFEEGKGLPFIQSATDTNVNNATSTKQNLSGETGLLVQASDEVSGNYLHGAMDLVEDGHDRRSG